MADWVKLDPVQLGEWLGVFSSSRERGEWAFGFQAGALGAMLRPGAPKPEIDGHAKGAQLRIESTDYKAMISEKRRAAGSKGADAKWGRGGKRMPNAIDLLEQNELAKDGTRQDRTEQESFALSASAIVEIWNEETKAAGLPTASLDQRTEQAIADRLHEAGWLDDFRQAVAFVPVDPFFRGVGRDAGPCTLRWLVKPGNASEVAARARCAPKAANPNQAKIDALIKSIKGERAFFSIIAKRDGPTSKKALEQRAKVEAMESELAQLKR